MSSFEVIESVLNQKIISTFPAGGGCIGDSTIIETEDGGKYFLKKYRRKNISDCEAIGLCEIAKHKKIKVPNVIWHDANFILLEFIQTGKRNKNFFGLFGSQLAEMHKVSTDLFGFFQDNFIGSNKQINIPQSDNWIDFYWNNRIIYQVNLAASNGYDVSELMAISLKIEKKLDLIIPAGEPASLIHGDLWSGNFLIDANGSLVIIDPAVYYGNREAELAMTLLFGGFDDDFYLSYNETYPLEVDWKYRIDFYKLYHVLNHLNLFGIGYYQQALKIMQKYL